MASRSRRYSAIRGIWSSIFPPPRSRERHLILTARRDPCRMSALSATVRSRCMSSTRRRREELRTRLTNWCWRSNRARAVERGSQAGRAEAAGAARRGIEVEGLDDVGADDRRDHQLGYSFPARNGERRAAEIDQDHHDLAAIVGVDRARRIEQRDAA